MKSKRTSKPLTQEQRDLIKRFNRIAASIESQTGGREEPWKNALSKARLALRSLVNYWQQT